MAPPVAATDTAPAAGRPRTGLSRRRKRHIGLAAAIALVAVSNVMSNRILPAWAYVPWNCSVAIALLLIAYVSGLKPVAVGLGIRHWHRPVSVGLFLATATAIVFTLGVLLPGTRTAFLDSRANGGLATMLYQVLLRIPLGTAFLEEVAFRGVLPALMGASPAIRWRWGPVLGASFLFGLWHILPSMGINTGNKAVADTLHGSQWLTSSLAVLSMFACGIALCALARLGKGIKTTMLLHWATNSLGYVAAWSLLH